MPQNIFKIYDGRNSFWQWDTKQKLIVLNDVVTEVHFSNRDMSHSIPKNVYTLDGQRVCDVPDVLLQLPRNLVASAYADGSTIKSVKFAVMKKQIPDGYVEDQADAIEEKLNQIDGKIESLNDRKADNIYYDKEAQSVQLVANGELIGDVITLPNGLDTYIVDCTINAEGHLVVTFSDGRVIDAGYVGVQDGVVFTPHISEDLILSWTNNGGLENPEPVDLNPYDEWTTLPEEGVESEYEWEFL